MWDRRRCLKGASAAAVALAFAPAALAQRTPTPQTDAGPMQPDAAPSKSKLWQPGDPGEKLHLRGRVIGTDGRPVGGATLMLWQADGTGSYPDGRYRAQIVTGDDGSFQVLTVLPGQYWGAKHIHVAVSHDAHQYLSTRILFRGDPNIDETDGDLAIPLEEVRTDEGTVLMGGVEFVLEPAAR